MARSQDSILRRLVAEGIGTAGLLAAVVGSGIMGDALAGGNVAVALLANSLATGGALAALIATFGPISGAHFNPVVTLALTARGHLSKQLAAPYIVVQLVGACAGVACAHVMFGRPLFVMSERVRAGGPQMFSEFVATFGLLAVIWSCARTRSRLAPIVVAGYIVSAYWFTASTSFANPAVTIARALTNTFAGIRLFDVPAFLVAQLLGAATATALFAWLLPDGVESGV